MLIIKTIIYYRKTGAFAATNESLSRFKLGLTGKAEGFKQRNSQQGRNTNNTKQREMRKPDQGCSSTQSCITQKNNWIKWNKASSPNRRRQENNHIFPFCLHGRIKESKQKWVHRLLNQLSCDQRSKCTKHWDKQRLQEKRKKILFVFYYLHL